MIISIILTGLSLSLGVGYLYTRKNPQFGGKMDRVERERLEKSPQWRQEIFENETPTAIEINLRTLPGLLKEFFRNRSARMPDKSIPIVPFDREGFERTDHPQFIWYGHSTCLLRLDEKNILIDPMFGQDASPVGPMRTKRYSPNSLEILDSLPQMDLVLITHDHYDHLDYHSILKLKEKTEEFIVLLGVGRHLKKWGVQESRITEVDWWDELEREELLLAATPSRHFSGRGAFDRAKSLWGGFVIASRDFKVYWSGDGGYGDHFKQIGERYGPFDWGFMECGQYNEQWKQIHMMPEESVIAALDARVSLSIPVHWGAFTLALHHWKEPVDRFVSEARLRQQPFLVPEIGESVVSGRPADLEDDESWWNRF